MKAPAEPGEKSCRAASLPDLGVYGLPLYLLQETVAASMTDLERKNLRRAMYSREAVRTEDDEEGEGERERTA